MTITPLYAGLLAFWFLVLSYRVVQKRSKGINLGDGGDAEMLRRIRGHGNFAEYVPIILIMMGMLELGGTKPWLLHTLGALLVFARVVHGYAFTFTEKWFFGRFYGTLITFILLAVSGGMCVWQGISAL